MKKVNTMLMCVLTLTCLSIPVAASANIFNGGQYTSSSNNVTGASADITYSGLLAVYNDSMSSIWVMIHDKNVTSGAFAQVGYAVDPPGKNYVYYFFGQALFI